jgi:hypothetical protein
MFPQVSSPRERRWTALALAGRAVEARGSRAWAPPIIVGDGSIFDRSLVAAPNSETLAGSPKRRPREPVAACTNLCFVNSFWTY